MVQQDKGTHKKGAGLMAVGCKVLQRSDSQRGSLFIFPYRCLRACICAGVLASMFVCVRSSHKVTKFLRLQQYAASSVPESITSFSSTSSYKTPYLILVASRQ